MLQFNVSYFDGKSSAAHKATLQLFENYWEIHFTDQDQIRQIVHWETDAIERDLAFDTLFIFRYGDFPKQTLECKDENLLVSLKTLYPAKPFFSKKSNIITNPGTLTIAGLVFGLAGFIVVSYLYILPWFAETAAGKIPLSLETKLGETIFENTVSKYQVEDKLTKKVNNFVGGIDFKTDYPISVTVVKEDEMNAFALPGGHIIIFDKLLRKMQTKEELAALLAHEVAHVHYKHSLKSIFRSLSGYLLISLIFNDVSGVTAVLADNSNTLLNLNYSRNLETEADEKAFEILRYNGLNINGFVRLFDLLKTNSKDLEMLKLLSTHPLTDDRIAMAKKRAKNQKDIKPSAPLEEMWREIVGESK